jgi:hypothetical protein
MNISQLYVFYGEELLAPLPTPKLEDHPMSAFRDCLFNIFAATFDIGGPSSIRIMRTRHAVVTGTHLSRCCLTQGEYPRNHGSILGSVKRCILSEKSGLVLKSAQPPISWVFGAVSQG